MFDYVSNMQLAVKDSFRRSALMVVAGLFALIGIGFLIAALWVYLAAHLDLGAMNASLILGGGFMVIALILLLTGRKARYKAPTTDDLKQEVEARLTLAADAAAEKARAEVQRVVGDAQNKASALFGGFGRKASRAASAAAEKAENTADDVKAAADSNAGSMGKLMTAFAIGVTAAAMLNEHRAKRRQSDNDADDHLV